MVPLAIALIVSGGIFAKVHRHPPKRVVVTRPSPRITLTPAPTPSVTVTPTPKPTLAQTPKPAVSTPGPSTKLSTLGQIFPADNPWNQDISHLPVNSRSDAYLQSIGITKGLHPDFGTVWDGAPNGIPYTVVSSGQSKVPITFTDYGDESDPGPYPIPSNAAIEGGSSSTGDRHVLVVDKDNHKLYELYAAYPNGSGWKAAAGAIYDLTSNALRPKGWTSADAAGLPIFPGLVRYDEASSGSINHALRFTASKTQKGFIAPARHFASSSTDPSLPPMGLRVRLKASVNISSYPQEVKTILQAMKTYGMILADNGSSWFVSGAPDSRWSDDNLAKLGAIKGSDFEVVTTGPIEQ